MPLACEGLVAELRASVHLSMCAVDLVGADPYDPLEVGAVDRVALVVAYGISILREMSSLKFDFGYKCHCSVFIILITAQVPKYHHNKPPAIRDSFSHLNK